MASLKARTGRVNLTNVATLQNRKDVIVRFHRAYKETVDWMYSDPAALKHFADFSTLPEKVVARVRELLPKDTMNPDQVIGMDQIIAEAQAQKFIAVAADGGAGRGTDPDSEAVKAAVTPDRAAASAAAGSARRRRR